MAGVDRVNGSPIPGAFYGYPPLVLKILNTGTFTADSGGGTTAIVEGGYSKAVKAIGTVGSIIWLGTQTSSTFTVIVDYPSFNLGSGATTSGLFGALKDALVSEVGSSAGLYNISSATTLTADGNFVFSLVV